MRTPKDQMVSRVVVSLLVAVVLLITLCVTLNHDSLESSPGFSLTQFLGHSRWLHNAQEPAAVAPSNGDRIAAAGAPGAGFEGDASGDEEFDADLTMEDFDRKNSSVVAPVSSSGNLTVAIEESLEIDSGTESVDVPLAAPSPLTSPLASPEVVIATPVASVASRSGIPDPNAGNMGEAKRQRIFQPTSIPHYSFVKFSAYRQSLRTFFVTGITSFVARAFDGDRIAHTCEWHPADGALPVETEASTLYVKSDENHGTYSPAIINCTFGEEVGADGKGGLLFLRISTGYDRWERNRPVVAMEELPGEVDVVMTPPEKLPFKYAFCGAPMHGRVRGNWILQWMTYHHYLAEGKGHFFFYNMGGLRDEDKAKFKRFSDAGLLSITDILDPNIAVDYPTWYFHQVLFINDCLHRSRFMAERVFFFDYDEFLQIPAADTLTKFMTRYKDEPWISFGSIYANTRDCRNPQQGKSETPLERMLWRRSAPECRSEKFNSSNPWICVGGLGRRKYVVNPRETFVTGVHDVFTPNTGLVLSAHEAHILHYRSAPLPRTSLCERNVALNGKKGVQERALQAVGWIRDDSVSKIYSLAKTFPV